MRLSITVTFSAAAVWFFTGCPNSPQKTAEGTEQVAESTREIPGRVTPEHSRSVGVGQSAQVAKRTFRMLPAQPELSASIVEQANYIIESSAYWCGQLAQTLEGKSTSLVNDLLEELPVYLSAHRATLDLCYAKIMASEATILERSQGSLEVRRKRMAAIDSVKRELEAVESYLAKCDILWDEISVSVSGSVSPIDKERIRDWVSELQNRMEAASTMLQ